MNISILIINKYWNLRYRLEIDILEGKKANYLTKSQNLNKNLEDLIIDKLFTKISIHIKNTNKTIRIIITIIQYIDFGNINLQ